MAVPQEQYFTIATKSWNRAVLEKLEVAQLVKNLIVIHRIQPKTASIYIRYPNGFLPFRVSNEDLNAFLISMRAFYMLRPHHHP
jgi:hypothetical protein